MKIFLSDIDFFEWVKNISRCIFVPLFREITFHPKLAFFIFALKS